MYEVVIYYFEGKITRRSTRMRIESTHIKLGVFFLICCSTFSFLLNMELRLTLEYLTISPSSHLLGESERGNLKNEK